MSLNNDIAKSKADPTAYAINDISKSNPKRSAPAAKSIVECARTFGGGDGSMVEPLLRFA
jgi:hypothetical protein